MDIFFELLLLALGIATVKYAQSIKAQQPPPPMAIAPQHDDGSNQVRATLLAIQKTYPGLPAVPNNPLQYDGYIEEVFKRMRMGSLAMTVAQETHLQTQLNALQSARLAGIQTQAQLEQALIDLKIAQQNVQKRAEHADTLNTKRNEAELLKVNLEIAEMERRIEELKGRSFSVPPPEI